MPRPKKSPQVRQRRNASDLGLVEVRAASDGIAVPEPPADWLPATKQAWAGYWGSPQASLVMEADVPAISRLFAYRDELERAMRGFRAQRFVTGSAGQPRINPLAGHISALEKM